MVSVICCGDMERERLMASMSSRIPRILSLVLETSRKAANTPG